MGKATGPRCSAGRGDRSCGTDPLAGSDGNLTPVVGSGGTSTTVIDLKGVSDKKLLSDITALRGTERRVQLRILEYLAEIDRRRLYLPLGYGSLFEFCRQRLGYSEASAGRRIAAARCLRDFPRARALLAAGRTTAGAIARIARVITAVNAKELLQEIEGRSEREAGVIACRCRPQSAIRERVRPVWVRTELRVEDDRQDTVSAGPVAGKRPGAGCGENFTLGAESEKFPSVTQVVSSQEDTDRATAKSVPQIWHTSGSDDLAQDGGDERASLVQSQAPGSG